MEAFRIDVPEADLVDLRERLDRIRWAPEAPDGYGEPTALVRELAEYWRHRYDWRDWEARLNEYPQFTTTIDGTNVHFLHARSPEPGALPLVLTHGWPGSVAEFLDVLGPLSDPRRHGLDPAVAFHLVVPSLPGFGWSGPTPDPGWGPRRIARAWAELMRRLGYDRYGAAGNDWGSVISPEVGRVAPDAVIGVHVTQLFHSLPAGERVYVPPSVEPADLAHLPPADRKAIDGLRWHQRNRGSYHHVQAEQPQTLAHALTDSPVGLLAWNGQSFHGLDPDMLLTHVSIYWFTRTAGSAMRLYADDEREGKAAEPTTVPLGFAQFPHDAPAIRTYAERDHARIVSWNTYDRGTHWTAREEPGLLIDDMRAFFANVLAQRHEPRTL